MSARTVAMRLTTDSAKREEIERLLATHQFTDRECEAVLLLVEFFGDGVREAGGEINDELLLRAGAKAVDSIWVRRSATREEVPT